MRPLPALGAALLLAGCWQAPEAPRPKSDEPNVLPPGLWSVSRSVLSQQVGEGDPNLALAPTPKAETHCLMEPVSRLAVAELLMDVEGAACTLGSAQIADGRIAAQLSCTPPPTHRSNVLTASGTYTHDRFSVEVEQKAAAVAPGEDSQTRTAVEGRRLGEC